MCFQSVFFLLQRKKLFFSSLFPSFTFQNWNEFDKSKRNEMHGTKAFKSGNWHIHQKWIKMKWNGKTKHWAKMMHNEISRGSSAPHAPHRTHNSLATHSHSKLYRKQINKNPINELNHDDDDDDRTKFLKMHTQASRLKRWTLFSICRIWIKYIYIWKL